MVQPPFHLFQAGKPVGVLPLEDGGFRKVKPQHIDIDPQVQGKQHGTRQKNPEPLQETMAAAFLEFDHQGFGIQDVFLYLGQSLQI